MTAVMAALFQRIPIGWLQLIGNPGRFAAAIAGVAFANVLVFMQLGILGALNTTIDMSYGLLRGDILISSSDANTIGDGSPLARQHMFQALSVPGVEAAIPVYIAKVDWKRADGATTSLQVYGLPPEGASFAGPTISDPLSSLSLPETALIDLKTRRVPPAIMRDFGGQAPVTLELNSVAIRVIDGFAMGGGFGADGNLVVSDQTFFRLFPSRAAGTPTHVLIRLAPGATAPAVIADLRDALGIAPLRIRTLQAAMSADRVDQNTTRPTGIIFGFGVFIGELVGLVIVYQVLASDVADHLREYATFKAMGYGDRFFLGVVFEEAVILAVCGFLPGVVIAMLLYQGMGMATALPLAMDPARAVAVFVGTVVACTLSGALATRRLAAADPADLF